MAQVENIVRMMDEMKVDNSSKNAEIATKLFEKLSLNKSNLKKSKIITTNPRNAVFLKLKEILNNEIKSKNLEISIYNWTIHTVTNNKIESRIIKRGKQIIVHNNDLRWDNTHFKRVYLGKYRSIIFNLTNMKNPIFKENVLNNLIQTKNIVHMKPEEIFPDIWKDILEMKSKKELIRLRNEGKELEEAVEGNYTCSKCKCKKVTYYELQTRSADEPMTAYFTCLNCNNHWKE